MIACVTWLRIGSEYAFETIAFFDALDPQVVVVLAGKLCSADSFLIDVVEDVDDDDECIWLKELGCDVDVALLELAKNLDGAAPGGDNVWLLRFALPLPLLYGELTRSTIV